jgi:hypothetical protein
MQRIIDPTASATLPAPPALTGTTGYFQPAVPGISAATRLRYWFVNMLQEELMSILAAASVTADTTGTVFNQVLLSIQSLIGAIPHGVATITISGSWTVPAGVTAIDVELWAGGSGSWASVSGYAGGGGSGGGYSRKRISGLTPGATIAVTIGAGGTAGVSGTTAPGPGGASSFGSYCSATGGVVNPLGNVSTPSLGNLAGVGSGGDLNLYGGDGGEGGVNQGSVIANNGGAGGEGPLSGGIVNNAGGVGTAGRAPGGGASGAGSGSSGTTPQAAAAGAAGFCTVRW